MNWIERFVFVVVVLLITFLSQTVLDNFYFTTAFVFGLVGAFVLQGTKKIPSNPPHKGLGTLWGKRIEKVSHDGKIIEKIYDEGWGFFPFFPYYRGFILVKVERINFEVISMKTRTLDRAESRIPVSITIRPLFREIIKPPKNKGEEKEIVPPKLIQYLNSGGEKGVISQLSGKIQERIREWASSPEEGPATWMELNQSQLEGVSILVKHIAGRELTKLPECAQEVPSWIWLRYFMKPQPEKIQKNEEKWAKNDWRKVKEVLTEIGPQKEGELRLAVEERRKAIKELRGGNGNIVLENLGVVLERLNIGDIDVLGEVAKQAEGQAKEEEERLSEETELKFVRKRIRELMQPPFDYSKEQARDIVQVERGKVQRNIDDKQISVDKITADAISNAFGGKKSWIPLI